MCVFYVVVVAVDDVVVVAVNDAEHVDDEDVDEDDDVDDVDDVDNDVDYYEGGEGRWIMAFYTTNLTIPNLKGGEQHNIINLNLGLINRETSLVVKAQTFRTYGKH